MFEIFPPASWIARRKRNSILQLFCLGLAIPMALLPANNLTAQDHDQSAAQPHGVPYDWSHHHLIFSDPGTAEDAMRKGTYDHWFHVVNDSRYVQHQIWTHRRRHDDGPRDVDRRNDDENTGLWGQSLGSAAATVGAGMYPAKYAFTGNTLNCATASQPDFVVYNTSVAGASGQATVVAFDNLYAGTCPTTGGHTIPQAYWSYNTGTGSTVVTSVVLSTYGNAVAFVQSSGGVASLVLLRYAAGEGTSASAPANPDSTYTCTGDTGACSAQATLYANCQKSAGSCELILPFSRDGTATASPNDTISSPYYDYSPGSDTIWVGDNSGYLHKFTGVFNGAPVEAVGSGEGGWPVQVSTATRPNLTAPVYESNSKLLFVNDSTGYLHSVTTTGGSTQTVNTSGQMECGSNGFADGPIVDSTTGNVYIFAGDGCDVTPGNSYINRFNTASIPPVSGYGLVAASFGNHTTNTASTIMYVGTFDNLYFEGTGNTGNMYDCVNGVIYQTTMATLSGTSTVTTNAYKTAVSGTVGSGDVCSPVSELLGTTAATTLTPTALGNSGTTATVTVASGIGFANNDYIRIDSEIMQITSGGGSTSLVVNRKQQGTAIANHAVGAAVDDIKDWLFASVSTNGNLGGCSGACLYNFNVIGAGTTGTVTAARAVVGGTSGITVDNTALSGGSQIYFTYQGAATAGALCPSPSSPTTGTGCAVQASQVGLN